MASGRRVSTLILGGGLAGVSTAYHLKNQDALLVERERSVGGTARSVKIKGFTFDFTGHLLHLHTPYTKKLIRRLLGTNVFRCQRRATIFSHGTYTRYPFQANTYGLPDHVIDECVLGFLGAFRERQDLSIEYGKLNFADWSEKIFGEGISRHFMWPYNRKIYQTSPKNLTVDWCGSFVPNVKPEEVIRGALTDQDAEFGYNTWFLYPKRGGIQVLAESLAAGLRNLRLGTTIRKINWRKREVSLSDGSVVSYQNLVNSIPLKNFLGLFEALPADVRKARRRLKAVGILCLNMGVNRARISDSSWIYFPESKFPFYRVGFPMNFTPHVVPRGCSSMYVEIPFELSQRLSRSQLLKRVRKGLIDARILKTTDRFLVTQFLPIPTAYVIYDRYRSQALSTIFRFFKTNKIQSIGRYGAWKYSFMEEAILDGKKAAENIGGSKS